jgi:hypothetical protein
MAQGLFSNQLQNRSFLSPAGFKFILSKYPKIDFLSNEASIPGINLGVAIQPNYFKNIPIPGEKLSYDDFSLRFIVDEDLENYLAVHNWLRGFGFPSNLSEYQDLLNQETTNPGKQTASSGESNGTLIVYNSNFNPIINVNFTGLFPVSLSSINFDATVEDINYVTAEVTFKYTIYDIKPITV